MTRVAITTDRFANVALGYVEAGLVPVSLPCIRFSPAPAAKINQARSGVDNTDLLMLTSPRAVELLWPRGGMPNVAVAAVGSATAATVTRAGGRVELVGDAGLARLIDMAADVLRHRKVMIAHASGADPEAMSRLRTLVPDLTEHVVYQVVPVGPPPLPIDAVAFASPSAVKGWCLTRTLDDVVVGAIGSTTAAEVARHREPDVVADRPSHLVLARAIAASTGAKV